jgi:HK97 family phage major capsid protein
VSGLTVYYPGEGVAITDSSKAWDMVSLTARKYACLAIYSSELFEDAIISIGDDLAEEIAYAFALAEDTNGFNGDGTSAYAGTTGVRQRLLDVFTTSGGTGLILVADVASVDRWAEILLTDFEKMLGALPIYARRGAKWFCSSTFFHTVMHKLQLAAGGNTAMDIANGGSYRFLGIPVEESQVFPVTAAASHIPCVLGNLALASKLGDRRELTLAVSDQYRFAEDQLAIKGTQRIDINVHDVGATGVAGPVVGLLTNASAS